MDSQDRIMLYKSDIDSLEKELDKCAREMEPLEKKNDVQKYLACINSEDVQKYIALLNNSENLKKLIKSREDCLNRLLFESCSHKMVLMSKDSFWDRVKFHYCTCLNCYSKVLINIANSCVYMTDEFSDNDIPIVEDEFKKLVDVGKAKDERIIIVTKKIGKKVKSRRLV